MEIYFITAIIFVLFSIVNSSKQNRKSGYLFVLMMLYLWFVSAFRDVSVGTDTIHAEQFFNWYDQKSFQIERGEFFYNFIIYILKNYGLGFRSYIIVSSTIMLTVIGISIYRISSRPIFTVMLLFMLGYYFTSFNLNRQMTAAAFTILAIDLMRREKIWYALALIVGASFIHTSAIFSIILWPLSKLKLDGIKYSVILMITFIVPFLLDTSFIYRLFVNNINQLDKYSMYIDDGVTKSAFSINRLLVNVFLVLIIYRNPQFIKSLWLIAVIWGVVILNLFPTTPIIGRVALYFTICQIFAYSEIAQKDKVVKALFYPYCITVFLSYVLSDNGGFVPYAISFQ